MMTDQSHTRNPSADASHGATFADTIRRDFQLARVVYAEALAEREKLTFEKNFRADPGEGSLDSACEALDDALRDLETIPAPSWDDLLFKLERFSEALYGDRMRDRRELTFLGAIMADVARLSGGPSI